MTDHTISLRAQCLDRSLRGEVEVVCEKANDFAAEVIECMAQQQ
jgi:hypothetical protein